MQQNEIGISSYMGKEKTNPIISNLFSEPKIIAIVGNPNEAKSNLIYHLIFELKKMGMFKLYTYGLRNELNGAFKIFSIEELEQIKNSVIILDEVITLWDLNNRMAKRQIENTLRLIFHNNNILVICATPENIRKFIAGKINAYFFKKITLSDLSNGSKAKIIVTNYKGNELGSSILNLEKDETILFDGLHYYKLKVPYYGQFDTKRNYEKIVKNIVNQKV